MGAGAVWFDADGDGYPDLFLVNSRDWAPKGRRSLSALYRNNRNGTFTDVTGASGVAMELFGMGAAAASTTTTVGRTCT